MSNWRDVPRHQTSHFGHYRCNSSFVFQEKDGNMTNTTVLLFGNSSNNPFYLWNDNSDICLVLGKYCRHASLCAKRVWWILWRCSCRGTSSGKKAEQICRGSIYRCERLEILDLLPIMIPDWSTKMYFPSKGEIINVPGLPTMYDYEFVAEWESVCTNIIFYIFQ